MEKQDTLKTVIQVNRIIVGTLILLFVLTTEAIPLGLVALLPLISAVVILFGILGCPPIPVIITRYIERKLYSVHKESFQDISERYAGHAL